MQQLSMLSVTLSLCGISIFGNMFGYSVFMPRWLYPWYGIDRTILYLLKTCTPSTKSIHYAVCFKRIDKSMPNEFAGNKYCSWCFPVFAVPLSFSFSLFRSLSTDGTNFCLISRVWYDFAERKCPFDRLPGTTREWSLHQTAECTGTQHAEQLF